MIDHKVWRVGANIDTDALAPGAYMKLSVPEMASHCLENSYPGLAGKIRKGDVIVAGENFGIGSSREQAVAVLVNLGLHAVIAPSFSGLYFRNAFNLGLLAIECEQAHLIPEAAVVSIDAGNARITVKPVSGQAFELQSRPIPDFLIQRALKGGLMAQLEEHYLKQRASL